MPVAMLLQNPHACQLQQPILKPCHLEIKISQALWQFLFSVNFSNKPTHPFTLSILGMVNRAPAALRCLKQLFSLDDEGGRF